LEDAEGVVLVDACQTDQVHAVDGSEVVGVVCLKHLLSECDHFRVGDVEATADPFEQCDGDVEVDHQHIAIQRGLHLQWFVLPEEGKQELTQFLSEGFQVYLLFVGDSLVDLLLDECLALEEAFLELSDEGTLLFILDFLFGVLLFVTPKSQHYLLRLVELVVFAEGHFEPFEFIVSVAELGLARHVGQFLAPEVDGLYCEFMQSGRVLFLLICIWWKVPLGASLGLGASSLVTILRSL
jgi:hypothetical protein